jgi:hypothetical protein
VTEITTDVPGAKIRKIKKLHYVVVNLKQIAQGSASIKWLAKFLHLQPETVLSALLGYKANAHVIKPLFRDYVSDQEWTNFKTARMLLKERAYQYTASDESGVIKVTSTPYMDWNVVPDPPKPILLPLTEGFRKFLKETTEQRKRMARFKTASPTFEILEKKDLPAIRIGASTLGDFIKFLKKWTKKDVGDVLLLEALDGLLGAMLNHSKDAVDADKRADAQKLRDKLLKLKNEAHLHILLKPPSAPDVEKEASDLLKILEDPAFVKRIKVLVEYRDVAGEKLWTDTCEALRQAYVALLLSPKAEYVIDNHVIPMICTIASRPFDTSGISGLKHSDLANAIKNAPPVSGSDSVLNIVARPLALVPNAVVRFPGPQSLSVAVVELAAPLIMGRILEKAVSNPPAFWGARLYRFIVNAAGLDMKSRVDLILAIDNGKLNELKKVNWSKRFMNSPTWGSALAIVGAITLIAEIQKDDANTLRHWSNIIASSSTTALGLVVAFSRYNNLIAKGLVRGIGGKALGVVGAIAGVISGIETAKEEYGTGDYTGAWLAGLGALGGAMTVAGFLIASGAGASATVAGAPVGLVLIIAGTIVAIGTGIWAFLRDLWTPGTEKIFEVYILHFERVAGPYDMIHTKRPALEAAYKDVKSSFRNVKFWEVKSSLIPELYDVGFPTNCISAIVDEKEDFVKKELKAAKRSVK